MDLVRRYRRPILFVLTLAMLAAMTYGFLRRVGVDLFARDASEESDR